MRMILMTLIFNLNKMTLNRMTLMQHKFLDLRYVASSIQEGIVNDAVQN